MCIEDIRIGRKIVTDQISLTNSGVAALLVDNDDWRTSLSVYPDSVNDIWISIKSNVAVGNGILIPAKGHPVQLTIQQHGDCVRRAWHAIASAGPTNINALSAHLDVE